MASKKVNTVSRCVHVSDLIKKYDGINDLGQRTGFIVIRMGRIDSSHKPFGSRTESKNKISL